MRKKPRRTIMTNGKKPQFSGHFCYSIAVLPARAPHLRLHEFSESSFARTGAYAELSAEREPLRKAIAKTAGHIRMSHDNETHKRTHCYDFIMRVVYEDKWHFIFRSFLLLSGLSLCHSPLVPFLLFLACALCFLVSKAKYVK